MGEPPRLTAVNARRNARGVVGGDDEAVLASEGAVHESREIADVVIAGQHTGVEVGLGHVGSKFGLSGFHLL